MSKVTLSVRARRVSRWRSLMVLSSAMFRKTLLKALMHSDTAKRCRSPFAAVMRFEMFVIEYSIEPV